MILNPNIGTPVASGNNRVSSAGDIAPLAKSRSAVLFPFTIAAAGYSGSTLVPTTLPVPLPGNNFYMVSANGTVSIRPANGGSFQAYPPSTGLVVAPGSEFQSLEIANYSKNPVTGVLFVGFGGFIDNRLQQYGGAGAPTIAVPFTATPDVNPSLGIGNEILFPLSQPYLFTLPAYSSAPFAPYSLLTLIGRVAWFIQNLSTTGSLLVVDENFIFLQTIPPNSSALINTTDQIGLWNQSSGTIQFQGYELWTHQ